MNKMKLEYFAHARGNNFTYQCNGEIVYIGILDYYYLSNLGNQGRNWIIILVALRLSDVIHTNAVQNITKA